MGMDFTSTVGDQFHVGGTDWSLVLTLAESYGWVPAGTQAPDDYKDPTEWEGEYASNDGQVVTREDASLLADALTKAVEDPALGEVIAAMVEGELEEIREEYGDELADSYNNTTDPEEYRELFRDFSEFARKGAFVIE